MTPEQWHRVKEVFEAALEREPGERSTFVGQACAGDELLCREVKSLLSSHEQESKFMEGPAAKLAAQSLVKEEGIALVGQHLGHYQIVREIGRGGMGVVYLAQDISLGRSVALKLLPTHLTGDPDRVRRFEREARSASALNHPNVCVIHAINKTEDDLHFIAMEYVDGTTLRQRLTQGSMKLGEALGVAVQIAAALAAAHDAGVVHRDIKPENIMVRTDGLVKVLDFGLAKLAEPQTLGRLTQGSASTEPSTETGFAMGTPRYMSPEQARGVKVDARADIWSLGVVTYEMIAGRPPFAGDSAIEVMNAILKEEPPQLGEAKVAPALERIVRRCLEKKPEMRFQSASDLGFALEAMSAASGSRPEAATALPAAPESPRKSRLLNRERWIWLAASVSLALTALGLAWAYFARQPIADTRVMKFSILPPERTSFGHLAISPDGRWLAFTAATGGKDQLWVRALDSTEAKALDGTEGATYPFWSPESRSIGFFAGGKLKKIEVSGGLPATLCDVGVGTGGAWSRDGVILFSSLGGAGLSRVSATGGEVTSVIRPDWKRQETDFTDPCFLPDGRHFIYSKPTGRKEDRGVYFGSLNGVVNQRVLGDESNAVYAASSRGGGYLLFGREAALMAQPFDAAHGRLTGEPFTVAARVGAILSSAVPLLRLSVSVSENGVLVFDPLPDRQRNQMIWMDRGGRKVGTLDGMDNVSMLRFSPDDKRFIVSRSDLRTGGNDLWISDVSGGNVTRFTFE